MDKYQTELQFAKDLAQKAINIAKKYYKNQPEILTKTDETPVTIADQEISQMVIESVQKTFPNHGILGEEESVRLDRAIIWVCDPIDGTIAFAMGLPTFMFSIAMIVDGAPVVAVTADLSNGRIFYATKNHGAFVDGKKLQVSVRKMKDAWISLPSGLNWLFSREKLYKKVSEKSRQTNVVHGSVFKGMQVAEGLADGSIFASSTEPWDLAAVKLIVEEAGGKVTDHDGNPQNFSEEINGAIVSNGIIHDDLLQIIQENQ